MDLSSLAGSLKDSFGGMAEELVAGVAQKMATSAGVPPEKIQSLIAQAKEIMADGKISPDEVTAKISLLATEHGVPDHLVETATSLVMNHINSTKK